MGNANCQSSRGSASLSWAILAWQSDGRDTSAKATLTSDGELSIIRHPFGDGSRSVLNWPKDPDYLDWGDYSAEI